MFQKIADELQSLWDSIIWQDTKNPVAPGLPLLRGTAMRRLRKPGPRRKAGNKLRKRTRMMTFTMQHPGGVFSRYYQEQAKQHRKKTTV